MAQTLKTVLTGNEQLQIVIDPDDNYNRNVKISDIGVAVNTNIANSNLISDGSYSLDLNGNTLKVLGGVLTQELETAGTNDIEVVSQLSRRTSGTAATGLGLSQDILIENDNGDSEIYAKHIYSTALALDGFELVDYTLQLVNGPSGLVDYFKITGSGKATLDQTQIADITTAGAKAIVTKEYLEANLPTDTNFTTGNLTMGAARTHELSTYELQFRRDASNNFRLNSGASSLLEMNVVDKHGISINATGTAKRGLSVSNNSSVAGIFSTGSGTGAAYQGVTTNTNSNAFLGQKTGNTNPVIPVVQIEHTGTGDNQVMTSIRSVTLANATAAAGLGTSYSMYLEADSGTIREGARFQSKWIVATDLSHYSETSIWAADNGGISEKFTISGYGWMKLGGITATAASALTPAEGMVVRVTDTDGTFTSIGYWAYENSTWVKW